MYPPMLPGGRRPGETDTDQQDRLQELNRGYEDSPWLTTLVLFSGFLVALVGTFDALFLPARHRARRPDVVAVRGDTGRIGGDACLPAGGPVSSAAHQATEHQVHGRVTRQRTRAPR
jgi:hypothetical protein